MAVVAMFFDRSDFILVLAQLDIEGNILTKILKKFDQWSWRRFDNKTVNAKFHKVRAGNQTAKFVDGPDFFLYLHN